MRTFFKSLVATAILASPVASHAGTVDLFTLTGKGLLVTFSLPETPAVDTGIPDLAFLLNSADITANGSKLTARPAQFNVLAVGGGFALLDDDDPLEVENTDGITEYLVYSGAQIFSGTVDNPTFLPGSYTLDALYCPGTDPDRPDFNPCSSNYNLDITQTMSATPEPGSLMLVCTGLLGAASVSQRRRGMQGA